MFEMKLCWLVSGDSSGGISPVVISCCRQAVQAGHETTMLMVLNPTWITSDDFKLSSLGLTGCAPETPQVLMQWLKDNPQDVLLFNGCREVEPIIPHLPPTIKCITVIHDTAPHYWLNVLKEEDNIEAVVAVSESVACKFRHLLKQPQMLSVIHNGCSFPDLPVQDIFSKNTLIFLGGDSCIKGAIDVLKLWKNLVKQGFNGNLKWVGNISPEFKAKIRKLPDFERIKILERLPRDQIFQEAASAKVLLMLSRVEPFGMVTIEAMSMGCVPVAWDIETGTKSIVRANQNGLFAPLGNFKALAREVIYACENYPILSSAAIKHSRSNFNEKVMWNSYEKLINHVAQLPLIERSKAGQELIQFQTPRHRFQLLPPSLRSAVRSFVGRSPRLGYWLRDMRGW